jgi:Cyclic nucleotide-binding domain
MALGEQSKSPWARWKSAALRCPRRAGGTDAMTEPVEALIRGVPFFGSLDRVDIARLTGSLEEMTFSAGESIFAEGDDADALYLLEAGRVAVSVQGSSGQRLVAELEGPDGDGDDSDTLGRRQRRPKTASRRLAADAREEASRGHLRLA